MYWGIVVICVVSYILKGKVGRFKVVNNFHKSFFNVELRRKSQVKTLLVFDCHINQYMQDNSI